MWQRQSTDKQAVNTATRGLAILSFVTLSVGSLGQAFGQISTSIQSSDETELRDLGSALSKISGEECAVVEASEAGHTLDTLRCLPAPLRRLVGKTPEIHGPNCYNLSNMTSGLQPFVRYVSEVESEFYTNPLAGYCTELKRAPEPGDYVMVIGKADGLSMPLHSYIYLTDKFAITKNGSDKADPWKIGRMEEIREMYMSSSNYAGSSASHSFERVYYKCSQKGEAKDPSIREVSKKLHAFGQAMEAPMLAKPITRKMMTDISKSFQAVKKSFDSKTIATIKKSSDRYEGMRPLLELYSHFAALKMINTEEPGRFDDAATVRDYKKFREEFVTFSKQIIERTDSLHLVADDLR